MFGFQPFVFGSVCFFFLTQMLWRRCFEAIHAIQTFASMTEWPMTRSPSCWCWWDSSVVFFQKKGLGELVERNLALKCFTINVYCVDMCGPNPSSHWAIPKLSSSTWELLGKKITASLDGPDGASFIVAFVIALNELHTLSMGYLTISSCGNLQSPNITRKASKNYTGIAFTQKKKTSIIFVKYHERTIYTYI